MEEKQYSIIEYRGERKSRRCGYCHGKSYKFVHGMWAHSLNVEDYQDLLDRGWRRSGKYCYKPQMNKTCCPQYGLRCHATNFNFSKSKKRVAKKMRQFLLNGGQSDIDSWIEYNKKRTADKDETTSAEEIPSGNDSVRNCIDIDPDVTITQATVTPVLCPETAQSELPISAKKPRKGLGADPERPPCKKAKQVRMERKMEKLKGKDASASISNASKTNQSTQKSLGDFLPHLTSLPNAKHKLEVRLLRVSSDNEEFVRTKKESLRIYQKYQVAIHNDTLADCSQDQFDETGPGKGFGSYHNQYWMDGKLIAVGVIDVLPKCVSSVYLYYDPNYGFLSLGIYSALSEIHFITQLHRELPSLQYYVLGYYVRSCPKMQYKSAYQPSELLCPETYNWVSFEKCLPTLDKHPYARLNELNGGSPDDFDRDGRMSTLNAVRCLYRRTICDYGTYKKSKNLYDRTAIKKEDKQVEEYVSIVGRHCAQRLLLFRS